MATTFTPAALAAYQEMCTQDSPNDYFVCRLQSDNSLMDVVAKGKGGREAVTNELAKHFTDAIGVAMFRVSELSLGRDTPGVQSSAYRARLVHVIYVGPSTKAMLRGKVASWNANLKQPFNFTVAIQTSDAKNDLTESNIERRLRIVSGEHALFDFLNICTPVAMSKQSTFSSKIGLPVIPTCNDKSTTAMAMTKQSITVSEMTPSHVPANNKKPAPREDNSNIHAEMLSTNGIAFVKHGGAVIPFPISMPSAMLPDMNVLSSSAPGLPVNSEAHIVMLFGDMINVSVKPGWVPTLQDKKVMYALVAEYIDTVHDLICLNFGEDVHGEDFDTFCVSVVAANFPIKVARLATLNRALQGYSSKGNSKIRFVPVSRVPSLSIGHRYEDVKDELEILDLHQVRFETDLFVSHKWNNGPLDDLVLEEINEYLRVHHEIKRVWVDCWCVPQNPNVPFEEKVEFLRSIPELLVRTRVYQVRQHRVGYENSLWCLVEHIMCDMDDDVLPIVECGSLTIYDAEDLWGLIPNFLATLCTENLVCSYQFNYQSKCRQIIRVLGLFLDKFFATEYRDLAVREAIREKLYPGDEIDLFAQQLQDAVTVQAFVGYDLEDLIDDDYTDEVDLGREIQLFLANKNKRNQSDTEEEEDDE